MRLWIIGPPGGGKTALLCRLRRYLGPDQVKVRCLDLDQLPPAALGAARASSFAIAMNAPDEDPYQPGERVVYVDRAVRHSPPGPPRPGPTAPAGADVWLVPEGEEALGGIFEEAFLRDELRDLGATLTLLPRLLDPQAALGAQAEQYINRRLRWGIRYLELRDDLLDDAQLLSAAALVPAERRLVSARRRRPSQNAPDWEALRAAAESAALLDWPVELGPPPDLGLRTPRVASLHARLPDEPLADAIARLEAAGAGAELLKLAAPIHDLRELLLGHAWVQRDPARHQFLPSSADGSGRWAFYRLWRGAGQRLNFLREVAADGTAPAPDQPCLYDWLLRQQAAVHSAGGPPFAALLGDPVAHSRTPAEQRVYFQRYGWPVFLIAVTDADLRAGDALAVLSELGLRAAAVTAPRKHDARAWLRQHGGEFLLSDARDPVEVCNTLGRSPSGHFFATNTDGIGLRAGWQALAAEVGGLDGAELALWGGGGTQALLQGCFPQAVAFSARTGQPRTQAARPDYSPDVVVWAVGRSRQPGCVWPPTSWRPRYVFDLNYSDDSPGREYAARCGARYESGLRFFRAQAEAQRCFWDRILS